MRTCGTRSAGWTALLAGTAALGVALAHQPAAVGTRIAATLATAVPGPIPAAAAESCAPTADGAFAPVLAVRADRAGPPAAQPKRRGSPQGQAGAAPRRAPPPTAAAPAEAANEPEATVMLTFYTCVEARPAPRPVGTGGLAAVGPLRRT